METPPAKRRLLIVDDEPGITRLLRLNLERLGAYEVREENSSVHALEAVKAFKPHLILMDLLMPGISGRDVAAQLRKDPELQGIPLIFLTGAVGPQQDGATDTHVAGHRCLVKPLNIREVAAVIERVLGPC